MLVKSLSLATQTLSQRPDAVVERSGSCKASTYDAGGLISAPPRTLWSDLNEARAPPVPPTATGGEKEEVERVKAYCHYGKWFTILLVQPAFILSTISVIVLTLLRGVASLSLRVLSRWSSPKRS